MRLIAFTLVVLLAQSAQAQEVILRSDDGSMEQMWSLTSPQAGPADWIGVTYQTPYEHPFRVVRTSMNFLDTYCCPSGFCTQACGDAGIPDFEFALITGANTTSDPSGLTPSLIDPISLISNVPLSGAGASAMAPPWVLYPFVWEQPSNTIFDRPGRIFFAVKYFAADSYMRFAIDANSVNQGTSINTSDGFSTRSAIWSFGNVGMTITVAPLFNLKLATSNPSPSFQLSSAQNVTMLSFRISGEQATSVTRVRVTGSGTGDDRTGVTRVKLVVDADDDGVADAGETVLASTSYSANDGVADLSGFSRDLGGARAEKWLVVYDFSGSAIGGQTFSARVSTGNDVSSSIGAPYLSGAIQGPAVTVAGLLTADRGPSTPPGQVVAPSASNVSGLQVRLRATNETFTVSRIDVSAQGTMNELAGIQTIRLYRDLDSSGTVTTGDVQLATGALSANDGSAQLAFTPVSVPANGSTDFLVACDLTGSPTGGEETRFLVALPTSVAASGVISGAVPLNGPRQLTAFPIIGNAITIGGALSVAAGAANPGDGTAQPNTSNVPMLQLALSAAAEAIDVTNLTIRSTGSGDEPSDVARVRLYRDANGNGIVDGADVAIGSPSTFSTDDGTVTFGFAPETIPQSGSVLWLVAFDFSSSPTGGESFRVAIESASQLSAEGHASRSTITPSGAFPVRGGSRTLLGGFSVSLAAESPTSTRYQPGTPDAPVLAIQLSAQGERFEITRLRFTGAGTLDDRVQLRSARLRRDVGPVGIDAGDPVLGTAVFDSDDGLLSFDLPSIAIAAGTSERWVLSYDAADGLAPGLTFRARIASTADISVRGALSGPTLALGLPVSSETHAVGGTLTVAQGPANPTGGSVRPDARGVVIAQVRASAVFENITYSQVRFRARGTGNEITDVSAARLYVDADRNGALDAVGDIALGSTTYAADDGAISFAFGGRTIVQGATEDLILVYDLAGSASAGETFGADILFSNDVAAQAPSGPLPGVSGVPVQGSTLSVLGSLLVVRGASSPAASIVPKGQVAAPVFQFDMRGLNETFSVTSISVEAAGSIDDPNEVSALALVEDVDHSGTLTSGDRALGTAQRFSGDDGAVTFSGLSLTVDASPRSLLLLADFTEDAESGRNFRIILRSATNIIATGVGGRGVADAIGLPISSSPVTIGGSLDVSLGPQPPFASIVRRGDLGVEALQLELVASEEAATIDRLRLHATGSFADESAIANVELFVDADGDGTVDAGEQRVGSGRFASNDGSIEFTVGQLVQPGAPLVLLARVDLGGTAIGGQTFRFSMNPTQDVAVSSASGAVTPSGASILGSWLTAGGRLRAAASSAQAPGTSVNQSEVSVPVLALTVVSENEPCTVSDLRVSAAGSIHDALDVASVRLLRDSNRNGRADAFDQQLATGRYAADDGVIDFSGLARTLGTDATEDWLVVYDLAGTASNLETFRARVIQGDISATCSFSGPVEAEGLPVDGPLFTVEEGGALLVGISVDSPSARFVQRGVVRVPTLGMRLQARVRPVSVDLMTLTASVSGAGLIDRVEIFRDANKDGVLDRADAFLASGFVTGQSVALATQGLSIDPSEPVYLLAVVSVSENAQTGGRFALGVTNASDVPATSELGSVPTIVSPFFGAQMTVAGDLNVSLGSGEGERREIQNDSSDVVALDLRLESPVEAFTVTSLTLTALGSMSPARHLRALRLVRDDGDGTLGSSDVALASGLTFAEGQRRLTISGLDVRVDPATPARLFVVADFAGDAHVDDALSLSVSANVDISATGDRVGQTSPVGAPLVGSTFVVARSLVLETSSSLSDAIVSASASDVVALALRARAQNEDVTLSRLTFSLSGALRDDDGIQSARLFFDANANGALDASDAEIARASGATADDGKVTFAPLAEQVSKGSSTELLVVLDLSGAGSAGEDVRVSLASDADVTAFGALSGSVGATGAPVVGPKVTLVGALNVRLGPASPTGAGVTAGTKFPALQLEAFTQGEGVQVDQLALMLEGSLDDASAVARVVVHADRDGDGVVSDGDLPIGEAIPDGNDGQLTFTNLEHRIEANQSSRLLAVVELTSEAQPGGTLRLGLTTNDMIRATGETSGAIGAIGAPISGSEFTVVRTPVGGSQAPPDEGCSCATTPERRGMPWGIAVLGLCVLFLRRSLTRKTK